VTRRVTVCMAAGVLLAMVMTAPAAGKGVEVNLALMSWGGGLSGSSSDWDHTVDKVFDGDPSTWWHVNNSFDWEWLVRDLGVPREVHRIRIIGGFSPPFTGPGPVQYAILGSADGVTYRQLASDSTWVQDGIIDRTIPSTIVRYVKLRVLQVQSQTTISEFEIYGYYTPPPPSIDPPAVCYVNDTSTSFSGSTRAGEVIRAHVSGEQVGETTAGPGGTWDMTITGLKPGVQWVVFTATAWGVTGEESDPVSIYVDLPPSKADLQAQIATLQEEKQALVDQNAALTQENAAVKEANATLAAKAKGLETQVIGLQAANALLKSENNALEIQAAELQNQIEAVEEANSTLAAENNALKGDVASLTKDRQALTAKNTQLKATVTQLEAQVASLKAANDTLAAENKALKAQVNTLTAVVGAANNALAALQADLRAVSKDSKFVLPGTTVAAKTQALVNAIKRLPRSSKLDLYQYLKRAR